MGIWQTLQKTKWMGIARVLAYGTCVSMGLAMFSMSSAKASMADQGMVLGRDLEAVADLLDHTYQVRINGQSMFLSRTEVAGTTVSGVLDRFESYCNANPGLLAKDWKDLPTTGTDPKTNDPLSIKLGVLRQEKGAEGMVGCVTKGTMSEQDTGTAWNRFMETGDVGHFGKMRFAFVRGPSPSGRISVTTLWTENTFSVTQLMPPADAKEDTMGTDSPTVGRPVASRRLLTGEIAGAPFGFRLYESSAPPEQVLGLFDSKMLAEDWMIYTNDPEGHVYVKGGVVTLVSAARDKDGQTVVSVNDLGAGPGREPGFR